MAAIFLLFLSTELIFATPIASGAAEWSNVGFCLACSLLLKRICGRYF